MRGLAPLLLASLLLLLQVDPTASKKKATRRW